MTALINPAGNEDAGPEAPLCDPVAPADAPLALGAQPDPEAWRSEVAARLARYRTRRKPRAPRYPSLLLPFDSADNWSRRPNIPSPTLDAASLPAPDAPDGPLEASDCDDAGSIDSATPQFAEAQHAWPPLELEPEPSAKVIEFPRSAAIPILHTSALADPIFDRPRIVEAPEVVPPPPALGGILIEPIQRAAADIRPDFRLQSASLARRVLAAALDGLILSAALAGFAAIFLRFNHSRGPFPLLGAAAAIIALLLWMAYQFLFVVYTGSTPGLRAAHLVIASFDGLPISRSRRRWRVLASYLSAFSAGLGYLWCFIDQDSLCWHDRITRTHLQPEQPVPPDPTAR